MWAMMQKLRSCPGGVFDGSSLVVARGDKGKSLWWEAWDLASILAQALASEASAALINSCLYCQLASKLNQLGIPKTKEKNGKYQVPGQENLDQQEGN
jgi:hypothetical protein